MSQNSFESHELQPAGTDRRDRAMTLASSRRTTWREFGDPEGLPLIALHGTPGSRLKFTAADTSARSLGIRVIAPDRWGYGGTDANPAPTLAAFADEIAELAAHIGLRRFALLGVSGGGPYAAAVASCHPSLVTALALAAPVGPIAGEPDREISVFHRWCFGRLARNPAAVGAIFGAFRSVLGVSPKLAMRLTTIRTSAADRMVLRTGDTSERLGRTFVEGLRPGSAGPVIDMTLFGRNWNVELARARVPARLWLGTKDQNVPLSAARRLAQRLPCCEVYELPGAGHLWIALNYAVVLRWIAETQKGAAASTPSD